MAHPLGHGQDLLSRVNDEVQLSEDIANAIARCVEARSDLDQLREALEPMRASDEPGARFAVAVFDLDRARRGDADAREALVDVADRLLVFWREGSGDRYAALHPEFEALWRSAAALLTSFEDNRFAQALAACWQSRADASLLQAAIERLEPSGNRRAEFARCLYHLELARMSVDASRREFARRAGLLSEAYQSEAVAAELVGDDEGLGLLWNELEPYLDEFFELMEEEATRRQAEARAPASDEAPAGEPAGPSPRREKTDPAVPAHQPAEAAPAERPRRERTDPELAAHQPAEAAPTERPRRDRTDRELAAHAPVEPAPEEPPRRDRTDRELAALTPPHVADIPGGERPADAANAPVESAFRREGKTDPRIDLRGLVSGADDVRRSRERTDPELSVERLKARGITLERRDETDPRIVSSALTPPGVTALPEPPPEVPSFEALMARSGFGDIGGAVEQASRGAVAPPPAATPPHEARVGATTEPDDELLFAEEAVVAAPPPPPPPGNLTPPGSWVPDADLDIIEAPSGPPPPPTTTPARGTPARRPLLDLTLDEPDPDAKTMAWWAWATTALRLLPDPEQPRAFERLLNVEDRADRKKLSEFLDAAQPRLGVPDARAFSALLRLMLAGQLKEKSLFGQKNARRTEAFALAFSLVSNDPRAAGHAAVWFELDGPDTLSALHRGLDELTSFLAWCARARRDPLDLAAQADFLRTSD